MFFQQLFKDPQIALGYLNKTIELFKEFDHEYLILDASEYFYMNVEESEWHLFQKAFTRNESAKEFIFNYSGFDEKTLPYPVEELYSDPYLDDHARLDNSNALNPNFSNISSRIKYPFEKAKHDTIDTSVVGSKKWWQFWKS